MTPSKARGASALGLSNLISTTLWYIVWRYLVDPTETLETGKQVIVWRVDVAFIEKSDWTPGRIPEEVEHIHSACIAPPRNCGAWQSIERGDVVLVGGKPVPHGDCRDCLKDSLRKLPNQILVDPADLTRFTTEIFERAGMPREHAEIEADVLVWANLRGVDSHGVLRIPWYVKNIDDGVFNLSPNIEIEKETAATLLIEGDQAFGPVVTVYAMNKTIEKAREAGVCWTLIRNTTHQGAMAYYSLMAVEEDMAHCRRLQSA